MFFMDLNDDHPCKKKQLAVAKEVNATLCFGSDSKADQGMGKLQDGRKQLARGPYLEEVICERRPN